jgi:hypothetical protein
MKIEKALAILPATAADRGAVVRLWKCAGLTVLHNDPGEDFDFAVAERTPMFCSVLLKIGSSHR